MQIESSVNTNGRSHAQQHSTLSAAEDAKDSREAVGKFWHEYMTVFDELNKCGPYRATVERHIELMQPAPGELIFDAGSGTGNLTELLVRAGAQVEALDFCPTGIEQARKKLPAVNFRLGDLREPLPFPDAHFDKVGSCLVMHLLDRRSQEFALRECSRVLKPGGMLAVSGFARGFRPLGPVHGYLSTLTHWLKTRNALGGSLYALLNLKGTFQISYYIWQIMGREKRGVYDFFCRRGLHELLSQAGLEMTAFEPVFAGQCALAIARKPDLERS